MPMLRVNATTTGLQVHGICHQERSLYRQLCSCAGPVIILLHGYKYAPGTHNHCPHQKIFAPSFWPAQLGFECGNPREGLCVALGWYARGALRDAHRRASDLGSQIAQIVSLTRRASAERPVHILAHSLGVELALNALEHLPEKSINRMIFLTGASYQSRAVEKLSTPAGRSAEVLNIVSRENDLFDAVFETLVPAQYSGDQTIGHGIKAPNVVNLQIDCAKTILALNALSFGVSPVSRRISHRSAYLRSGLMGLYRSFLRQPEYLPLSLLSEALPPQVAPR